MGWGRGGLTSVIQSGREGNGIWVQFEDGREMAGSDTGIQEPDLLASHLYGPSYSREIYERKDGTVRP